MTIDRPTDYYNETAASYDSLHGEASNPEHVRALELGWRILGPLGLKSVLDVGCGSGRALAWFDGRGASEPGEGIRLAGVDPSDGMLAEAKAKVPHAELTEGRGEALPFEDESFDLVIATGILHHADAPKQVIREMFRCARKAVLISDHNNFAFGSDKARRLRLGLYALGLLDLATYVKQGFNRQGYSDDDGWWYPYSVLNDLDAISGASTEVFVAPTRPPSAGGRGNFMLSHSHLALIGLK
ncbi:MAG: class I SAM-dependent methyltransferase [Pseudomonadota bacterium]